VFWNNLISGQCGIDRITAFDAAAFDTQIAGEVKNFDPARRSRRRRKSGARTAIRNSAFMPGLERARIPAWISTKENRDEIGVIIGSGIGGLATTTEQLKSLLDAARAGFRRS
jgi:3-oxoacyl-[acyl-carrier-protein] synthase II